MVFFRFIGVVARQKMNSAVAVFLLGWLSVVWSVPTSNERSQVVDTSFIGKGTNELATALLQGFVQKEENMVYSPFGYSAILAIFSEGAKGASREEIANALHFPQDVGRVRQAYSSVLERFVTKRYSNSPEFKNWFYIYKNYSVENELQNILRQYYLTEVKCVDRPEDYINSPKKSPIKDTMDPDQKIAIEMASVPEEKIKKDAQGKDQPEDMVKKMDETNKEDVKKEVKTSDMIHPTDKKDNKNIEKSQDESKITEKSNEGDDVKTEILLNNESVKSDETNPVPQMAPIKTSAEMGDMPMEHFSGMTDSSLKIKGQESKPRMVIFNGLYYKGEWENPFVKKPADDSRVFYKSDTEKIFVSTIHSQGVFNFGAVSNLDCKAIELPYRGGRYSLLILVPNTRNGLTKLISDLSGYSLSNIFEQLSEKLVDVCLPTFEINTISKPISANNKIGLNKVSSIFNPETADLSGISASDTGLYVEELVQMVTFKVDANYSKANFLTASIASSRSNIQKFQVNQPFLFYLRDNLEDIIIVNGKVIDPTPKPHFYFT